MLVYLTKDGAIGAQERGFAAVEITVVPHLAIGLRITKETLVTLLSTLEAGLRNLRIVGIINARTTCARTRMFIYG